jgi:selenocysteine lyase/cysteine desulfurase
LIYQEGARYDLARNGAEWVSRMSVHYYNNEAEIAQLDLVLRQLGA